MFIISPSSPILDSTFDLITIVFITALLILSIFSLSFIFHLCLRTQSQPFLQDFNAIWTFRFLLVIFISFWAITELIRIPSFLHRYVLPLVPSLSQTQRSNICKIHVVLSLGFFEPAFLITLLLIVNASIKKKTPYEISAVLFVIFSCLPTILIHVGFLIFPPFELHLPHYFKQASSVWKSGSTEDDVILCSYPLWNTIVFAAFAIGYGLWFLFSCWRVMTLVINKGLRARLYGLTITVLVSLPLQIAFMGLSVMWNPEETPFRAIHLVNFFTTFMCAAVGQGILVIIPISETLEAGGSCCSWRPAGCQRIDSNASTNV